MGEKKRNMSFPKHSPATARDTNAWIIALTALPTCAQVCVADWYPLGSSSRRFFPLLEPQ